MIRSALIEKLNKYTFIQYIFVIFPLMMIVIYCYAYMTDMLSIARNLEVNNLISQRAWEADLLREVEYIEDDDGVVTTVVSGSFSSEETVASGEPIFYLQMYSPEWYQIATKSGEMGYLQRSDLFQAEFTGEDDIIRVTHDDISLEFFPGDIVCYVAVSPDGAYRVTFITEEVEEVYYDLDVLNMLELLPTESGGGYRVRVATNYELEVGEQDVHFCSNLPTSGLYFNEDTQSFVRNVSSDYGFTFIVRSNILIVFVSMLLYVLFMYEVVKKDGRLMLVQNKYLERANEFAVCMLPVCILMTVIML